MCKHHGGKGLFKPKDSGGGIKRSDSVMNKLDWTATEIFLSFGVTAQEQF